MIITKEIRKVVTQYNLRIFKNFGFKIGDEAIVPIENWDTNSHEKIMVKCDICGLEKNLPYREYFNSFKKYNIYSCSSKCSQFKNKETKKDKYGDSNFNNINKYKNTCLEKYGVDNIFKDEEFKIHSDKIKREKYGNKFELIVDRLKGIIIDKYGVNNISKLPEIKELKKQTTFKNYGVDFYIQSQEGKLKTRQTCLQKYGHEYPIQSDKIREKVKSTNFKKYGSDWYVTSEIFKFQIEESYGVTSTIDLIKIWKLTDEYKIAKESIYNKIRQKNISNGFWYKPLKSEYLEYRRKVDYLTKKNIKSYDWNGLDYYDNELIIDNLSLNYNDPKYPTIDHKISVKYGFENNIEPNIISSIENLCITKRSINSKKNSKTESEFLSKL